MNRVLLPDHDRESSKMLKVVRKQWFMLALPGLTLLAAFLLGGGVAQAGELPSAADRQAQTSSGANASDSKCTGTYHKPSFGSTVVVNSGEVICSDLTSFNSTVVVRGEVKGDVVAFGGDVLIGGNVAGNVMMYGGNVTLQNSAHVNGDIHVCGGHLTPGMNSQLRGSVIGCTQSVGLLIVNNGGPEFRFWSLITWLVLGVFLTSLFPEHVMLVRTTVKSKTRRSLVLGLLSMLLAPAVLAVLVALIISIPLAIIVAVAFIAAWALGTVAVSWLIGDRVMRMVAPHLSIRRMREIQIVVGLIVLALVGSLPYVGWLITLGAGLLGLGAVFLSRFGTRLYSPPKQPLPL